MIEFRRLVRLAGVLALIVILTESAISEKDKFKLSSLDGMWAGEGTYYLPFTNIPTSIDGQGEFSYDSATGILHTRFNAERFMIKYSDSGRMSYTKHKDSLKWDIWNSFGYYVQYKGGIKGKSIHGKQKMGKYLYDLHIDLVTDDSIKVLVTATDPDGESSERVTGYLRRTNNNLNKKK